MCARQAPMPERDEPAPPKRLKPKPIDGSVYGASSSESGGNYDSAGPTSANVEGEPADEEVDEALEETAEETAEEPDSEVEKQ